MTCSALHAIAGFALMVMVGAGAAAKDSSKDTFKAAVQITDWVLNTVNPLIFGDNIEWVNNGMGLWLPDKKELHAELVEELRAGGVTHLRYPGGTLSDFFDWSKAVGSERTAIPNPFAEPKGAPQYPNFGPDEFMALCRRLTIPGTITLNAGSNGSPEQAASWVKYCRDRDFPVTGFTVGNEIYMAKTFGEPIPNMPIDKTPQQYVEMVLRFKNAIEQVAPGTKLGVIGLHDTGAIKMNHYPDWMEVVLGRLTGKIDFIDVHCGYAHDRNRAEAGWCPLPRCRRLSHKERRVHERVPGQSGRQTPCTGGYRYRCAGLVRPIDHRAGRRVL